MSVQKPIRILYQAKNSRTGLTDVVANVYLNGVAKATGTGALALTELDSAKSPGLYELLIPAATLTTWGVVAGTYAALEGYINSATAPAYAPFREELTIANLDDIDSHLTTQDTAIAAVKSDTAAIKTDLESGTSSLANILAAVVAIQNNAGFSLSIPAQLTKPSAGSNSYRVPITIYNDKNVLLDPDSQAITCVLTNQAGADMGSYMVGYVSGSPGSAPAVRDSLGQYHIDIAIPSTASQGELILTTNYSISGNATARRATTNVITDVQADGFALQSTLTAVQATVNDADTQLNNATYGLSAANTLQAAIKTQTDKLGDASIGLSAIKSAVSALQTDVTSNVEGSGFSSATDSLHQISLAISQISLSGGRAV